MKNYLNADIFKLESGLTTITVKLIQSDVYKIINKPFTSVNILNKKEIEDFVEEKLKEGYKLIIPKLNY